MVDAHTHVFVPEVIRERSRYVGHDLWFEHLYADPKTLLIDTNDLLRGMDEAGVDQAVVCGFPWHDLGICREHNDYMNESCQGAGGRLAWLGIVPAGGGPAAAVEAERCFGLGAAGIGELNADAQRFELTDPASLAPVIEVCLARDKPVMLHATEPVGHAYPGKGTATPDRVIAFLKAFPALRVVLAHWGGGLPFYELMPEIAVAAARVVYDSAASTYLYRPQVFRAVLDVIGPERVLFGSDYPVLRMDRFLRRVRETAALRPEELAPVLGGNARRVYGLTTPDADIISEGHQP
ncbi:MAG: amidohydrolase [Chloroflexota bacterium]|nr:amidohydrolase [Chloroflexota bacterium]